MKIAENNIKPIMFALFFCVIIGCGVHSKLPTSINSENFYATTLPIYHEQPKLYFSRTQQSIDTVHKKHNSEFQEKLNHLLDRSDKAFNSIDEILSINVEWQKRYMRVADTARNRKKGKDSLFLLLTGIRDTVNAANIRADKFQREAKQANFFAEQNKKISDGLNWQIYIGFAIIVILLILTNIYIRKVNGAENKNLNYAK